MVVILRLSPERRKQQRRDYFGAPLFRGERYFFSPLLRGEMMRP